MIGRIGTDIGEWMFHKGKIEEEKIDTIRYSVEILCSEFLEILTMIVYGVITGKWIESIMFVGYLLLLRKEFQGFHASTIARCFLITISAYLISMYMYPYVNYILSSVFLCISTILQIEYCIKKKLIRPFISISILHLLTILIFGISSYTGAYQLLVIVECIVSLSLIPKRRQYER